MALLREFTPKIKRMREYVEIIRAIIRRAHDQRGCAGVSSGMRFGICTDQTVAFEELARRWQHFEELGFDSVWDCDHLNRPSDPTGPYFEGWTLLSALAARTESIRVGCLVSCNTFRHPAITAQAAVTVDHVSNGRLELGFGAGWFEDEHARFGIDLGTPGERVRVFREAVHVLDSLLRNDATTFAGEHYQLADASIRPRAIQTPRPPLTLGAHRPKMLRICAEYADSWNSFGTVEEIKERGEVLDAHCAEIGRDPASIRRSLYIWTAMLVEHGHPDPWSSVDAFDDVVGRYGEVGIEEFILDQPAPAQLAAAEKIAADALPRLRRS